MSTNFLPACLDEPAAVTCFFAGRLRLRHPALRAPDRAEAARARLAATPGVHAVTVNPRTGSLLLEYDAAKPDAELLVRDLIGAAAPKPDRRRNGGTRRTRSQPRHAGRPGGHHRAGPGRPHARSHPGGRSVSDSQRSARVRIPPQSAALRSTPTETPSRRTGTAFQLFSKENRHQTAHALSRISMATLKRLSSSTKRSRFLLSRYRPSSGSVSYTKAVPE